MVVPYKKPLFAQFSALVKLAFPDNLFLGAVPRVDLWCVIVFNNITLDLHGWGQEAVFYSPGILDDNKKFHM
ncbi:MAG: hypothetical protein ACI9SK_000866, partial [Zhongshania sp.]